jgi:hypothetical protein
MGTSLKIFSLPKILNMIPTRMPRKACMDAHQTSHHIICHGIEGRKISLSCFFRNIPDALLYDSNIPEFQHSNWDEAPNLSHSVFYLHQFFY